MITLGLEAQKRAKEAFQRLDKAITADREIQSTIQTHARDFLGTMYQVFEYIERESLTLNDVFVSMQRIDDNQFEAKNKHYPPFTMLLDRELAYDSKPVTDAEQKTRWIVELAARVFVVFSPPLQGVLRSYTIFADGSWKRTAFVASADGVHTQSALLPNASPDILVMEAIDLLGLTCTHHPTWASIAAVADTLTLEQLADRTLIKTYLTGLGKPRS
jgi:hypothetical protein